MSKAIAILNKQAILERLQAGEYVKDIAVSLNVTPSAIKNQLSNDPEYQDALEQALDSRMILREQMLETAPDMLSVSRARELLRHAEFRASVECPKRWGKNSDVSVQIAPVFNVIVTGEPPQYEFDRGGVKDTDKG